MDGMWMVGLGGDDERRRQQRQAATDLNVAGVRNELTDLRERVARLALMNQALWELLRDRFHVTDDDLAAVAQEIDLRDGVADGRMTETAVRCPQCGRVSNSRHGKCLYCGLEFEKPAMG
jgi:DNA-directed RNA polymerase subunit RPC12/RpoP